MERQNFASLAMDLMSQVADPCEEWALKSQTAAVVAEVHLGFPVFSMCCALITLLRFVFSFDLHSQIVRREGLNLWQQLLPSVVTLSNSGPSQVILFYFLTSTLCLFSIVQSFPFR